MKHIRIRKKSKKELQVMAFAAFLYICYAWITGEVYKFQYFESRFVRVADEPIEFWSVIFIYTAICSGMSLYSVVGFPLLERYFIKAQENQNKELESRTIKQKLLIYLIVPLLLFAVITGVFVYVNR